MELSGVRILLCTCFIACGAQMIYDGDISTVCGPSNKCRCKTISEMDCSRSNLNLSTICEFIQNSSNNTTVLTLTRNRISSIYKKDLNGCENIIDLDLRYNEMVLIEELAFDDILNITHLNLQHNNLSWVYTKLDINIGLSNTLQSLKISGNANLSLPAGTFVYPSLNNLANLEILYMDGLPDTVLSSSYKYLVKLETLVLSGKYGNCRINTIMNETFETIQGVKHLNLAKCGLREIYAGGFQSLRKLENLDLSNNVLLGFIPLRNVSYSLQFTNIKVLDYSKVHETFGLTTEIKQRDLCYLRNTSLVEINLSRNLIGKFEQNAFILLPDSLNKIRVEDNKFTFGLYLLQLGCVSNVTEFYGSFQNIPHKPNVYDDEPLVNDSIPWMLSLNDCPYMNPEYLKNVSKTDRYCRYFEPGHKVNVRSSLPIIPQKLKKVEFGYCDMVYDIPKIFVWPAENNVEYIVLSGNVFNNLKGPIGPFPKLKYLDFSQCYCSHIYPDFFKFGSYTLESLLIQQNLLGKVLSDKTIAPIIFKDLVHLKFLNLSTNTIPSLPLRIFSNLNNLEILDLSVNNLETLDFDVYNLTNLLHLHLRSNFIQSLPTELLLRLDENSMRLKKNFTIDMRDNTIRITCESKDFLSWLAKHKSNMVKFSDYKFVDQSGKSVSSEEFLVLVRSIDKDCSSYTTLIVICSIGISVYLAVVIGGVIYRNRWNLLYFVRNAKIRHFRYRQLNDLDEVQYRYDVFISYANENNEFVFDKCMPNLEDKGLKLCLHDKDFIPGNNIADNIVEAISNSRKTICILSKAFLKSQWCLYEFNMARMESIYDRNELGCLVVVLLDNIASKDMPTEMLHWIRTNTYIEYTDDERYQAMFWENLQGALSDRTDHLQ
ncbi:Toll-like receptor 5 [Mactra antiquata]